jgi:hypothetical protein
VVAQANYKVVAVDVECLLQVVATSKQVASYLPTVDTVSQHGIASI